MFHVEHLQMKNNRSELSVHLKAKDHLISEEEFSLLHDPDLNMLYTDPVPAELSKYYDSKEYISHTDSKKTLVDRVYQIVKKRALASKISLVESYVMGERILLDIGAGTGDFVQTAKKRNWQASGIETSEKARALARNKEIQLMDSRPGGVIPRPTVITLWHVLEHLPDPQEYLNWIHTQLQTNGVLIIAVPNFKSWDANHYKEFWAAYDVPRHLWHFSKESIEKLTHEIFTLEEVRPMIFDAYYVSMLSEKYKTGKSNLIQAFFNGFRSNMAAWRTKEYSSLIYVLRKQQKEPLNTP